MGATLACSFPPLYVSIKKLEKAGIPFTIMDDTSPRTMGQDEYIEVEWQGEKFTYVGSGHFNSYMNYIIGEQFELTPTADALFEQYAREWAELTRFDFNPCGVLETGPDTHWKKGHPTFKTWVENNTEYPHSF